MHNVSVLMTRNVEFLHPQSTVREAAEKMRVFNIGALPICEGDRVIGMITDRDIVVRAIAKGRTHDLIPVSEVMSKEIVECLEDDTVLEALDRMKDRKVGRLVVLTHDHRIRGIISLGDIVRRLGEEHLAGIVSENVFRNEHMRPFGRLNFNNANLPVWFGTLLGISAVFAGVRYLGRQPKIGPSVRNKVGFQSRRAA